MFLVPVIRHHSDLDRLFDDTVERFFNADAQRNEAFSPAMDVTESTQNSTVKRPRVAREDVKIAIDGKQVSIEAEVRRNDERKEGDRVVYRERRIPRRARRFTLPAEVDQSESGAKLDGGVLTLKLAKKRARQSAQLRVR